MNAVIVQLAQGGIGFDDLFYVVIVGLSILGALGKKLRDKYQEQKSEPKPLPSAKTGAEKPRTARRVEPSEAEVILAELFDIPVGRARPRPPATKPPARAAGPVRPSPPSPAARQRPKPPAGPQRGRRLAPQPPPAPPPVVRKPAPVARRQAEAVHIETVAPFELGDLRRAVILSEILGPPMALRGLPRQF